MECLENTKRPQDKIKVICDSNWLFHKDHLWELLSVSFRVRCPALTSAGPISVPLPTSVPGTAFSSGAVSPSTSPPCAFSLRSLRKCKGCNRSLLFPPAPHLFFLSCQDSFILECFHFHTSSIQNVKQFMLFESDFLPALVKADQ